MNSTQHEQQHRLRQYQSLLAVAEIVATQRDLPSLFKHLAEYLHTVVAFDVVATVLHDPVRDLMCLQIRDAILRPDAPLPPGLPIEESPSDWARQLQQPLIISDTQQEERFPALTRLAHESGIRSYCLLPLTAAGRRRGALIFGRLLPSAFAIDDLEFLQQVANQVAMAVDNAINHDQVCAAEAEKQRRIEQMRLLLEVGRSIVSHLNLRELIGVISESLRQVIDCDGIWMTLYDAESGQLRVFALDPIFKENATASEGQLVPLEGTPSAQVLQSHQTIVVTRTMMENSPSPVARSVAAGGMETACFAPLLSQGRALGTVAMVSTRVNAFSPEDAELFTQIAGQIAIAVENALNFERAQRSEREVQRKFERERLMLEINNAVVSHLSLWELARVTASCLRKALGHEIVGLSLYDTDTRQLRTYAYDSPSGQVGIEKEIIVPLEGSLGGMAFTSGQPIFFNYLTLNDVTAGFSNQFIKAGAKSGGCVPLIVQGRKLGVIGAWNFRENAFPEDEQELLGHIANQIALAVENALNFERARKAEQEITRQLERERLMLEINNAVVAQLDLRNLVQVISDRLCKALDLAIAGVSLYDPEANCLRAYFYDLPDTMTQIEAGTPLPLEGSIAGRTYTTGQPVLLNRPEQAEAFPISKKLFFQTGIKSGGCVPLIVQGRKLGVLGVDSYEENAFPEERQQLLCQIADQLALAVDNALAYREIEALKNKLSDEKLYLEEEINTAYNFEEVIGSSPALKRILKQVATVAPTDSTVLIQGETGTGKELIARAIHNLSSRQARTLVKLNCAAIPSGLLESELFGHERGAFTGAIAQRIGRFELAHKGTLFLDEVGEIPLELQPKLLRVLQEQEFERLGNARTQKVDVRLIAATNRDLAQMSAENKYRSDLYYRLNVFPITIPPLRERHDDIPLLVRFFANKFALRMKKQIKTIPAESIAVLQQYQWPGNIRELENMIERAVILTQGAELQIPLPEIKVSAKAAVAVASSAPATIPDSDSLESVERDHIMRVLNETNWMVGGPNGAAARLGMKRTTLQARIKKLGITRY